jgi:hypothetical protein
MSLPHPDPHENGCVPDSSDTILVVAEGPIDRTVRPTTLRHLLKPQRRAGEQPPAPEDGLPERGPETK